MAGAAAVPARAPRNQPILFEYFKPSNPSKTPVYRPRIVVTEKMTEFGALKVLFEIEDDRGVIVVDGVRYTVVHGVLHDSHEPKKTKAPEHVLYIDTEHVCEVARKYGSVFTRLYMKKKDRSIWLTVGSSEVCVSRQ